jgi:hypothetical protein
MKNTMCPSPTTATAALALSLLQAPLVAEARDGGATTAPNTSSLSHVEQALVNGSTSDALKIINSSALDSVRTDVVAKDLPQVVAKVIKELIEQGKTEDAQRVFRTMRSFSPESAHQGAIEAFAALDRDSFEKFCDQSLWHGAKPYGHIREELRSPALPHSVSASKSAEMTEVMDRADTARRKTQIGLEVGAVCAAGIAAASGRSENRSLFQQAAQTIGGLATVAASTAVFCSLFGTTLSFWSLDSLIIGVSTVITAVGLEQIAKGLGLIEQK